MSAVQLVNPKADHARRGQAVAMNVQSAMGLQEGVFLCVCMCVCVYVCVCRK
jgi:hypothetical protein